MIFIDFRWFSFIFTDFSMIFNDFHWGVQNGWKSWKTTFYVFCLFTPLYRRFRLSRVWHAQDLDEIYRLVSKILNFTPCGLVFDRFCVEALKMAENHEKPCSTFFAFLSPYIGVSGSLVSRKRKSVKRSIDWYQKFIISHLAVRYFTVFVFSLKEYRRITT